MSPERAGLYKGCLVVEVATLRPAAVVRRPDGLPATVRRIELDPGGLGFGGACGYHPASRSGVVYSELFRDSPSFRLFLTLIRL